VIEACTRFPPLPSREREPEVSSLSQRSKRSARRRSLAELPARWQTPSGRDVIELGAARLPDHRLAYLDYEGPVSSGRGEVKRIDRGDYEVVDESPEWLRVRLAGAVAIGEVRLPIAPPPPATTSLSSS
jgi:hypothetical protein